MITAFRRIVGDFGPWGGRLVIYAGRLVGVVLGAAITAAAVPGGVQAAASDGPAAGGAATYLRYTGTASDPKTTDPKTAKFLYGETHVLAFRDTKLAERVVLYTCRDGSAFARKTATYGKPQAPDFLLEDASNGMREGVRAAGAMRQVFFRAATRDRTRGGTLPGNPGLVIDSGFDEFVRAHWQDLLTGKSVGMPFLVPSRLTDIGFQVRRVRADRVDGLPVELFRLKLSGILGFLVSGIDVYYSAADHVLVRYVGLSDLRNAKGDNFAAAIDFHPSDRKSSDVKELERAREVRLAPCQ